MNDIINYPKYAIKNRDSLNASRKLGCYHCTKECTLEEIREYTDQGKTAVCPHCGIDSVIGDSMTNFTEETLLKAKTYWFEKI